MRADNLLVLEDQTKGEVMENEVATSLMATVKQVLNQPACLWVIILINVVIFMWEAIPQLPSRLIVIVGPVIGACFYPLLAATGSVPFDVPHPKVVLVINGLLAGLVAVAIHAGAVSLLRKFTGWPPEPQKNNADNQTPPK